MDVNQASQSIVAICRNEHNKNYPINATSVVTNDSDLTQYIVDYLATYNLECIGRETYPVKNDFVYIAVYEEKDRKKVTTLVFSLPGMLKTNVQPGEYHL